MILRLVCVVVVVSTAALVLPAVGADGRTPGESFRPGAGVVAVAATSLLAQPSPDDVAAAKARAEKGSKHYNFGEYAQALFEYKEAYKLKSDPSLLFNIAQCHRFLKQDVEALRVYRSYLRSAPAGAPARAKAEEWVNVLESGGQTAPSPTLAPTSPSAGLVASPAPAPARAPSSASTSAPVYRTWWFWTIVGVVVIGGVGTAVALSGSSAGVCQGLVSPCYGVR